VNATKDRDCRCLTCEKDFHYLGIARHRAAHRDKKESCVIMYTYGDVVRHDYGDPEYTEKIKPIDW